MNPRYVCNELNRAGQIIWEDHRLSAIIFFNLLRQKIVLIHDARMTKYMEVASITGIEGVPLHKRPAQPADAKVV